MYLPPEHPIMSFETIEIKMAAASAKRSIVARFQVICNEVMKVHSSLCLLKKTGLTFRL